MRPERILHRGIDPEALVGRLVVVEELLPRPVGVAFEPEMVVGHGGKGRQPGTGLQDRLRKRDAGGHARALHLQHREGRIAFNVGQTGILAGPEGQPGSGKKQKDPFHDPQIY